MLTQAELKILLTYDPQSGKFIRNITTSPNAKKGFEAGCKDTYGRYVIRINNILYYAHRLAWLYVYGYMPELIDHIDMDKGNNKLCNLREGTKGLNAQNKILCQSNNKTGFLGVCFAKHANKFRASICVNRKHIKIGYFDTAKEASEAYIKAKRQYHEFNTL